MTFFYWFCWRLVRSIAQIILRIKVFDLENIPLEGSFIVASNHISLSDPPLVSTAIKRPVHFMAKKELFSIPVLGFIIRNLNAHPIHRGFDRRAIDEAVDILSRGEGLLIFPEGTRALHGEFLPARPGIGIVAIKTQARIIPTYIQGANCKKAMTQVYHAVFVFYSSLKHTYIRIDKYYSQEQSGNEVQYIEKNKGCCQYKTC